MLLDNFCRRMEWRRREMETKPIPIPVRNGRSAFSNLNANAFDAERAKLKPKDKSNESNTKNTTRPWILQPYHALRLLCSNCIATNTVYHSKNQLIRLWLRIINGITAESA